MNVGDMALKRRAAYIVRGLELESGDRVLDLGCGNGYYLYLLNKLNSKLELIGVDKDNKALKSAKDKVGINIKLVLSDAKKLPFKDNSFDKILASEVIEHIEDEKKFLVEIYRLLKPKGILILTTCNIDYPFFWDPVNWVLQRIFKKHIKSGFWAGVWNQHLRLYDINQLQEMLISVKFKIEDIAPLTFWCIPFNHYIVNFIAKLFYAKKLPKTLYSGMNKFECNKQPLLVKICFWFVNLWDSLNDLIIVDKGVSIFIKVTK